MQIVPKNLYIVLSRIFCIAAMAIYFLQFGKPLRDFILYVLFKPQISLTFAPR